MLDHPRLRPSPRCGAPRLRAGRLDEDRGGPLTSTITLAAPREKASFAVGRSAPRRFDDARVDSALNGSSSPPGRRARAAGCPAAELRGPRPSLRDEPFMRSTETGDESSISSKSFAFMRSTRIGVLTNLGEREPTPSFTLGVELFARDRTLDFAHFRANLTRANRRSIRSVQPSADNHPATTTRRETDPTMIARMKPRRPPPTSRADEKR